MLAMPMSDNGVIRHSFGRGVVPVYKMSPIELPRVLSHERVVAADGTCQRLPPAPLLIMAQQIASSVSAPPCRQRGLCPSETHQFAPTRTVSKM
jgi:hypothetical protein